MSDPELPETRRDFWSTVTCPRTEGLSVLVGGPIGFLIVGSLYGGLLYGLISGAVVLPLFLAGWAVHRILKAWAQLPAKRRWLLWIKAAMRYLLTDP